MMTRDELDAATDEQLNEMAAKVMGVKPRVLWGAGHQDSDGWYAYTSKGGPWYSKADIEKWIAENPTRFGKPVVLQSVDLWPDYSTNIADAWELVEKMRESGFSVRIENDQFALPGRGVWGVKVYPLTEAWVLPVKGQATAPRAITTAALLAWGEKENSK